MTWRLLNTVNKFDPLQLGPLLWFDASDPSTLYQDTAGTTAVTADGNPVGRILDKSGYRNHANRVTADTARALWKTTGDFSWLEFDGSNDGYALTTTLTQNKAKFSIYATIRPTSFAATRVLIDANYAASNDNYTVYLNTSGVLQMNNNVNATASSALTFTAATIAVMSAQLDVAGDRIVFSRNATIANISYPWTTATMENAANVNATMGGDDVSTGAVFLGRIYQYMLFDKGLSTTEHAKLVTFLGAKAGLFT